VGFKFFPKLANPVFILLIDVTCIIELFMNEIEFLKLGLQDRFERTRKEGRYVASRIFRSYEIHLYQCGKFYVEIWQKVGLNLVHFVEVLKNEQALDEYVGKM